MQVTLSHDALETIKADAVVIGIQKKKLSTPVLKSLDHALGGQFLDSLAHQKFDGKQDQIAKITTLGKLGASQVIALGLGSGKTSQTSVRSFVARASRLNASQTHVAVVLPSGDVDSVRAAAEGALLGAYRYTSYLTGDRKPKTALDRCTLIVPSKPSAAQRRAAAQGVTVGEAVNLARDLVNAPPNDLYPTTLAEAAKQVSKRAGITCRVFDKKEIEKKEMGLFLAVNRGSAEEPRLIHMSYKPARSKRKIVFVGKGVTFDAGGLCLKPSKSMVDMKCDMAGSAVTIATVYAAAALKLPIEVHGLIGATENMTGAAAYRPGDIFRLKDGKTVEIINTDAEGRLVLADVLAYARELKPDVLIDHATLTGACMVALGPWTAGLLGNSDKTVKAYDQAASKVGESFWRLPLSEDLRPNLKSDVADLKHVGNGYGGAITAALFLREFVGDSTWIHVDIAGPSFAERAKGLNPKGGTGFGVLTALRFLADQAGK